MPDQVKKIVNIHCAAALALASRTGFLFVLVEYLEPFQHFAHAQGLLHKAVQRLGRNLPAEGCREKWRRIIGFRLLKSLTDPTVEGYIGVYQLCHVDVEEFRHP